MSFVIGIDGGGSKTECLFRCVETGATFSLTGGRSNPQVAGYGRMKDVLAALLQRGMGMHALSPGMIRAVCVGMAGVGREQEQAQVLQVMRQIMEDLGMEHDTPCAVYHDAHIALRGALPPGQEWGMLVISGTGSVAYGIRQDGACFRNGGWGHLLGDEGSGYALGMEALRAVCRAADLREQPTLLTRLVLEEANLSSEQELIFYMYGQPKEKSEIARFAEVVISAADQGDRVAKRILDQAVEELVLHISSLLKQMFGVQTWPLYPIVVAGSIFKYSQYVKKRFYQLIETRKLGLLVEPNGSAAEGAVLIARELIKNKQ